MCKEHDIQLMAYSPLATGGLVNDEYVAKIVAKTRDSEDILQRNNSTDLC